MFSQQPKNLMIIILFLAAKIRHLKSKKFANMFHNRLITSLALFMVLVLLFQFLFYFTVIVYSDIYITYNII